MQEEPRVDDPAADPVDPTSARSERELIERRFEEENFILQLFLNSPAVMGAINGLPGQADSSDLAVTDVWLERGITLISEPPRLEIDFEQQAELCGSDVIVQVFRYADSDLLVDERVSSADSTGVVSFPLGNVGTTEGRLRIAVGRRRSA